MTMTRNLDTKSILYQCQNIFKLRSRKMGYFFQIFLTFSEYRNFTVKNGITLSLIDNRPIEKFGSSSWQESGNRCSLQKDNFVPPQFIREDILFLIKKSVIFKMFFSYLQFCQKSNKKNAIQLQWYLKSKCLVRFWKN